MTTFGTLARLPADVRAAGVAMLVVDEAHYVKNPAAARSQAVARAARDAQRVLFLTGTPMENRVEEFRNLVGYLRPEVAGGGRRRRAGRRRRVPPRGRAGVPAAQPGGRADRAAGEDRGGGLGAARRPRTSRRTRPRSAREISWRCGRRPTMLVRARPSSSGCARSCEEAAEDGLKVVVFSYFLDVLETVGEGARADGGRDGQRSRAAGRPPAARRRVHAALRTRRAARSRSRRAGWGSTCRRRRS